MKEKFIDWIPAWKSRNLVGIINDVLGNYEAQGYRLTLRQLYYQLVARDIIPNRVEEYKKLGHVVNKGRLAGMIDWDRIEDRIRVPVTNQHWDGPEEILRAASDSYYESKWERQEHYVEVWCEKDAVSNIIQPVCRKWDILFMANRGYSSQSAMYDAYCRISDKYLNKVMVIYLGDHDPSGMDMTRDIRERLGTFLYHKGTEFKNVRRVALNMDQIEEYKPPENPAKVTDSRYAGYVVEHGESSWELDALEPSVLAGIVEGAITEFVDLKEFESVERNEEEQKKKIIGLIDKLKE